MSNHRETDVYDWVKRAFGTDVLNNKERALRVLEEAVELAQAAGVDLAQTKTVVYHVFRRPVGDIKSEIGGTFITLEACAAHFGLTLEQVGDEEWNRICGIDQEHFTKARQRKVDAHIVHLEEPLEHVYHECKGCPEGCHFCLGGLLMCKVCGQAEAELAPYCQGPRHE